MIKLENVYKYYYSSSSVTCALKKINLQLNIGEFVAITGESGSGKTTLLNIISGLDTYEDGELYYYDKKTSFFDNEDWENYRKDEIAFIFQNYNLIDSFTVLENVIVPYIISGYSYKIAKEKAKEILKLVGLDNDTHKKATKLSGGQKQRLAIARALAKETKIIVADEPTGNLDAENGKNILEILKQVSKDKLVIVVTHNYAQIEPFITRKIRLHDGEIVNDEIIKQEENVNKEVQYSKKEFNVFKQITNFSLLNIKSQPKRTLLMLLLTLILVVSSFVFWGNFKANIDDNKTKTLDNSLFINFDETRLLVKDQVTKPITSETLEKAKVDGVVSVEKYDYITDCNYYRPEDYKYNYVGGYKEDAFGNVVFVDQSTTVLVNQNRFMRSASSLKESDLKYGRLPENNLEMVIYSNDESKLNTTEVVMFRDDRVMGDDTYYKYEVTIVGILKEYTEQAYFSEDLCQIMEMCNRVFKIMVFYYDEYGKYNFTFTKICIDYSLNENTVVVPKAQLDVLSMKEIRKDETTSIRVGVNSFSEAYEISMSKPLESPVKAIGVSKEIFDYIYNLFDPKEQFAVFIDDYANTEDVINSLAKNDLTAISCFKSSVTGYDTSKVIVRYLNLIISIIALLIVNIVLVLICHSILKTKKNDYVIFKMIGLNNSSIKKINYIELLIYGLVSNIILIILVSIIKNNITNNLILDILKHIRYYDYIIILVVSTISMISIANLFNKYLISKTKITVLREE